MSYFRCSCKEKAKIFTKQFLCIEPTTIGHSLKNTLEKMKSSKISLVRFFFLVRIIFGPYFLVSLMILVYVKKKFYLPEWLKTHSLIWMPNLKFKPWTDSNQHKTCSCHPIRYFGMISQNFGMNFWYFVTIIVLTYCEKKLF